MAVRMSLTTSRKRSIVPMVRDTPFEQEPPAPLQPNSRRQRHAGRPRVSLMTTPQCSDNTYGKGGFDSCHCRLNISCNG